MEKISKGTYSIQEQVQNIISVFSKISLWQYIAAAVVFIIGIIFSQTVGEFFIALQNRYAEYPAGTDTNMYGRSGAVSALFSLTMAWIISYIFKMSTIKWYIPASLLLLSTLFSIYEFPMWLGWVTLLIYLATIVVASIGSRILLFIPVLGFIIMSFSSNSLVPSDWCKYELTMYRCPEDIEYYINPMTGEKEVITKQ